MDVQEEHTAAKSDREHETISHLDIPTTTYSDTKAARMSRRGDNTPPQLAGLCSPRPQLSVVIIAPVFSSLGRHDGGSKLLLIMY